MQDRLLDAINIISGLAIPSLVTNETRGVNAPKILVANEAFASLCGYSCDELIGESPKILQGPETDIEAAKRFRDDIGRNGYASTTLVNYRKDGSPYEVFLIGSELRLTKGLRQITQRAYVSFSFQLNDAPLCLPRLGMGHVN